MILHILSRVHYGSALLLIKVTRRFLHILSRVHVKIVVCVEVKTEAILITVKCTAKYVILSYHCERHDIQVQNAGLNSHGAVTIVGACRCKFQQ